MQAAGATIRPPLLPTCTSHEPNRRASPSLPTIAFIGGGNMASAIIGRLIRQPPGQPDRSGGALAEAREGAAQELRH